MANPATHHRPAGHMIQALPGGNGSPGNAGSSQTEPTSIATYSLGDCYRR